MPNVENLHKPKGISMWRVFYYQNHKSDSVCPLLDIFYKKRCSSVVIIDDRPTD